MDKHPNINTTIRLPRQVHGGFPLLLSTKLANLVIAAIEGVLNLKINVPTTDGTNILQTLQALVVQGDLGMEVTMPPQGLPGAGGSNVISNVTWLHVQNDLGSSLQCVSWDGTNEGATPVYVAKTQEIRANALAGAPTVVYSDNILGTIYNYTYSSLADTGGMTQWLRSVTGGTTETDYIVPAYVAGREIYAGTISPGLTLDGNLCTLVDLSSRAWAKSPS